MKTRITLLVHFKLPLSLITKVITLPSKCAAMAVVAIQRLAVKMLVTMVKHVKKCPQKILLLILSATNLLTSLPLTRPLWLRCAQTIALTLKKHIVQPKTKLSIENAELSTKSQLTAPTAHSFSPLLLMMSMQPHITWLTAATAVFGLVQVQVCTSTGAKNNLQSLSHAQIYPGWAPMERKSWSKFAQMVAAPWKRLKLMELQK